MPQELWFDVRWYYPESPAGCTDDGTEGYLCYDKAASQLRSFLAERKFNLLEYLTRQCFDLLRKGAPEGVCLWVKVTKFPPIEGLAEGASFILSDWPDHISAKA